MTHWELFNTKLHFKNVCFHRQKLAFLHLHLCFIVSVFILVLENVELSYQHFKGKIMVHKPMFVLRKKTLKSYELCFFQIIDHTEDRIMVQTQ